MDAMDIARKGAVNNDDPFLRLPVELLLFSIFSRLDDLKSLFLCSLVSKHFASVISRIRTVSITFSGSETETEDYVRIMAKLAAKLYNSTIEQIPKLLESESLQHMKLPKFLEKLKELEHIHLDYKCPDSSVQSPFPTWDIKLAGKNAKIETFVALVRADSIQFNGQEQEGGDQEQGVMIYFVSELKEIMKCFTIFYGRYMEWICIVRMLLKHHTSLQRVTITDSGKHEKLIIGHEQLFNIENQVFDVAKEISQKCISTVRLPVLHLPLSGYVLSRPIVMMFHTPEDYPCASDVELTVIGEAIQVILNKHRDRIWNVGHLEYPDPMLE